RRPGMFRHRLQLGRLRKPRGAGSARALGAHRAPVDGRPARAPARGARGSRGPLRRPGPGVRPDASRVKAASPFAAALGATIAAATGEPFTITGLAPVSGGCIHTALRVDGRNAGGAASCFAKVNDASSAAMFAAEADGLEALRA